MYGYRENIFTTPMPAGCSPSTHVIRLYRTSHGQNIKQLEDDTIHALAVISKERESKRACCSHTKDAQVITMCVGRGRCVCRV
jgi:hypothetical protein